MIDTTKPFAGARVAVLCGGESDEREISLRTGRALISALEENGYQVIKVDATSEGLRRMVLDPPDVAVIALHGGLGENGSVQGLLESLGIPYTGSGVAASALAMNKMVAKTLWHQDGLPTPGWEPLPRAVIAQLLAGETLEAPTPVVVKPAYGGSSIGISLVRRPEEYQDALTSVLKVGGPAMQEALIDGREVTVALVGNQCIGTCEIVAKRTFYDYEAKYEGGGTEYVVPAPVTSRAHSQLVTLAQRAAEVLGTRGVARVDFILDADDRPWLLELNTVPGMTATSLVPKIAAATGISFADFVERMLNDAAMDGGSLYD